MLLTILGNSRKTKENIFAIQNHLWERLGNVKKMNKNTFVPYAIKQSNHIRLKVKLMGRATEGVYFVPWKNNIPGDIT